jgi:amidohydrolase
MIYQAAQELFSYSQTMRRDFHSHPELGFHEVRTANKIAGELGSMGYKVKTGIAGTGIKAVLGRGEPVLLLRFDMDALPIQEENKVAYRSHTAGVMHACGHDGHMAIGLTVAKILVKFQKGLKGTIVLMFQPAEEGLGGCQKMIAEGILKGPKPDAAFGMHIWNEKDVGWVGVTTGAEMAGADIFTVKISGIGGHGALPQNTRDPVVCAAQAIMGLQTIISRNIGALESGVVSVTRIKAGETFNVIPPQAEFAGTIRYFEPSIHETILRRLHELIQNTASSLGCKVVVEVQELTPALMNDATQTEKVIKAIQTLPVQFHIDRGFQTMGSEDFAYVLKEIPGCFFFLGSANKKTGLSYGHHNPRFNFTEEVMTDAAAILTQTVLNY